ncbi:MAG: exo-beta-N-acetylmuramidase NamZ domain-containing protein, partial [Kiritimatiellia bacterium]
MYQPGIETLDLQALKGAKVGLLSHQAATVTTGEDSATWLHRHLGSSLAALFAPEHGFFGLCGAGEHSPFRVHPLWKIPVWSLYGEHRAPTAEMLKGLDVLIVDLQDIAVRCYTYLATLQLTLRAAAKSQLPIIVCDRPHPFAHPDGPGLNPQYQSFVAPCDIPMVYARTQGEAAQDICATDDLSVALTVCAAKGEYHPGTFPSSLDFVPPSPAIRTWQ